MTYQNIRLSLHIPKIYTFKLFELHFWNKPICLNSDLDVVEEVLKCIMAIIDNRKMIIHMTLKMGIFDPLLKIYYLSQIGF